MHRTDGVVDKTRTVPEISNNVFVVTEKLHSMFSQINCCSHIYDASLFILMLFLFLKASLNDISVYAQPVM